MAERLTTLPAQLQRRAERHPERVLVHHNGLDHTFADVLHGARSVAAWLGRRQVRPGDRVALALPNSADYVTTYFGVQLAGGCAVTLDATLPGKDLAYVMNHAGVRVAVCSTATHERLAQCGDPLPALAAVLSAGPASAAIPRVPTIPLEEALDSEPGGALPALDAPAQIIYTSGTTGRPKGVVLTHRNLAVNTASIIASLALRELDSVLAILSFSYSYGNSLLLTHVSCGGRLVIASSFVYWNQVLELMERQGTSGLAGIPSTFLTLMSRSDFLQRPWPCLRYLTCAGGALPPSVADRITAALPHAALHVMYGQTEASARIACLPPADLTRKRGSAGRAIPGVEVSVRDEYGAIVAPGVAGEIVVRGENIMAGYFNDAEATARVLRPDGLHTGDVGCLDAEGYLYITGRRDDLIKSGGYRIGPQEIEDVALEVPGVQEAGVTGIPDEMLGAVPVMFVVPRAADVTLVPRLRKHMQNVLPRFKMPRDIHVVAELPRTANGKLRRRMLAEQIPS